MGRVSKRNKQRKDAWNMSMEAQRIKRQRVEPDASDAVPKLHLPVCTAGKQQATRAQPVGTAPPHQGAICKMSQPSRKPHKGTLDSAHDLEPGMFVDVGEETKIKVEQVEVMEHSDMWHFEDDPLEERELKVEVKEEEEPPLVPEDYQNTDNSTALEDEAFQEIKDPNTPAPKAFKSRKGMKLKTLSLQDKLLLLSRVDAGASMRVVCAEFDVKPSTFYDIKRNKDKIRSHALTLEEPNRSTMTTKQKRIRPTKHITLDTAVFKWYKQERAAGVPIRGVDIQNAATRMAKHLKIKNFSASSGWLFKFRSRHCLTNRKVVGESANADAAAVEPFRRKLEQIILESDLLLSQVYNADETALFWKSMPTNTQVSRQEGHIPGRKTTNDRVSIMCCANADGTHRLRPIIVGKAQKPRALKNIMANLPIIYRGNMNAWFTRTLFLEWFHQYFVPAVIHYQVTVLGITRNDVRAILLLDNAPAHPSAEELEGHGGRIKVLFMPPNTSSLIQPMDQGVIEATKRHYRNKQLRDCLVVLEDDEDTRGAQSLANFKAYNMRNAVFNWAEAWNSLKISTLINAWNKLLKGTDVEVDLAGFGPDDFVATAHKGGEVAVTEDNIMEWLESDAQAHGCDHQSEQDIAASVAKEALGAAALSDNESDEDEVDQPPIMKLSKLRYHLDMVMQGLIDHPDLDQYYPSIRDLRAVIIKRQYAAQKQTKISSFFKPKPVAREPQPYASSESGCSIFSSGSSDLPAQIFASDSD